MFKGAYRCGDDISCCRELVDVGMIFLVVKGACGCGDDVLVVKRACGCGDDISYCRELVGVQMIFLVVGSLWMWR